MALPSANLVQDALEQLYAVASDDPTRVGTRKIVNLVNEFSGVLNRLYGPVTDVSIVDAADADVAALLSTVGLAAGDSFRTGSGTADTTDNALATAKGSAVATNDVFVFSSGTTVAYLGNQTSDARVFDFAGETDREFDSIGS